MYRRYAVRPWFSIHTLRVRMWAWGFRYFRFYPLRGRKSPAVAIFAFGFCEAKSRESIHAGIHAGQLSRGGALQAPALLRISLFFYQRRPALPPIKGRAPCRNSETKARMSKQKRGIPKGPPFFASTGAAFVRPVYGKGRGTGA
jgi:hypothetical protein